jgi:hypothetical protein
VEEAASVVRLVHNSLLSRRNDLRRVIVGIVPLYSLRFNLVALTLLLILVQILQLRRRNRFVTLTIDHLVHLSHLLFLRSQTDVLLRR